MATAEVETVKFPAADLSVDVMKEAEELIAEESCEACDSTDQPAEYEIVQGADPPADACQACAAGEAVVTPVDEATKPTATEGWEHDLLAEIRELEKEVALAESSWTAAKEVAKARKAFYEEQVTALRSKIRQADEKFPLFDKPKAAATETEKAVEQGSDAPDSVTFKLGEPVDKTTDESWRGVRLEELQIKAATLNKLYESDLETVGDLSNWCNDRELDDIKGIGPAKVDEIETALEAFWKWREG